ncbi:MAG: hypothetical protein WCG35_07385 [Betaproteobacteria bacterium]
MVEQMTVNVLLASQFFSIGVGIAVLNASSLAEIVHLPTVLAVTLKVLSVVAAWIGKLAASSTHATNDE